MALGITDGPADRDHLGIEPYYKGLADFISGCPTPMTIAFQGDWGTGKTSAMNMVRRRLQRDPDAVGPDRGTIRVVEFNTWQYSQFDLGEELVFTLLQAILEHVAPPEEVEASRVLLGKVARMSRGAVRGFTRSIVGTAGGPVGQAALESYDEAVEAGRTTAPVVDRTRKLVDVRSEFARIVQEHVENVGDREGGDQDKGRVVVFIDDLDRLPPERAIEVMEALKTLFDCEGCVFVLAIDFEVVKRGVRLKYGDDMDDTKARAYFDKFIQVPFQMPVAKYDTASLLSDSLDGLGLDQEDTAGFAKVARLSVGANPRSLKRLLNTFILLSRVAHAQSETPQDSTQTFALLALEAAYPALHSELGSAAGTTGVQDLLSSAAGERDLAGVVRDPSEWDVDRTRAGAFREFAALLKNVLGTDDDVAVALQRTSLTAVGGRSSVEAVTDPEQKAARARAAGIGAALLSQARQLEEVLELELARGGAVFESALRSKPDWWHWYVTSSDGGKKRTWGQLVFPSDGSIRIYFGPAGMPEARRNTLERKLQELATRQGWRLETADKGSYFRLNGIGAADDVAELAPLLAECALIALG